MSAALDSALAELRVASEELNDTQAVYYDRMNQTNANNERLAEAQGRYDRARVQLVDAALQPE